MLAGELAFPKNCPMSSPSNNLSAYVDASPPARPGWDPQWLAANEHCVPEKLDSCRLRIDEELTGLVWRLSARHCGRCIVPSDPHFPEYLQRLKLCIDFHWRRWGETARLTFAEVVRRLDQERADAKPPKDNILAEVVLAQGLQLGEDQCARTFESIYMPVVRAVGRHLGGERAADVVENFAAELVLPRQGRPPRIATFQGRTTLSHWLVPVVSNYWRTGLRRKSGIALSLVPEPPAHAAEAESLDEGPCEGMLQHVFAHTAETLEPG